MAQMEPATNYADRLYLFWQAYSSEASQHLNQWHRTPVVDEEARELNGDDSNPLYDSFLNTWANGKFEDDNIDFNNVPWDQKTYFAALDVPSLWLRLQCEKVLKVDQTGKPQLVNPNDPDAAKRKIDELIEAFGKELASLKKIDLAVANELNGNPKDIYLQALNRMMQIETECFEKQLAFLQTGQVPPDGAPSS
jgi:hypothetical protein